MIKRRSVLISLAMMLVLTACGGNNTPIPPTARPTAFPTPLSNTLPTPAPRATSTDQTSVLFSAALQTSSDTSAISTLLSKVDQTIVVQSGPSSDALKALCSVQPTYAWVDGWTMLAALNRQCARVVMRLRETVGDSAADGVQIQILAGRDTNVRSVSDVKGQVFCRLSGQDVNTWIIPVLMLHSAGVDPFVDLRAVRDVPTLESLLSEVSLGRCVGAGVSGVWDNTAVPGIPATSSISDRVAILSTSPMFPFGALLTNINGADVDKVLDVFDENQDQLRAIVNFDSLIRDGSTDSFSDALSFLRNAGLSDQ